MKNVVIKTKFDDCKTLREILDKISNTFFQKASYYLINLWILYPLLMMFITYSTNSYIGRDIMFYVLMLVGLSGILLGTLYTLKKFYKNEKFSIKKYLPLIFGIILLIWCTFTSFFSENYVLTFTGELYRKEGLQTYFFYGGVLLLGLMIKNKNKIFRLINNLLIVEVVVGVLALLNNGITYSLLYSKQPYTGIFSQFNHYGYYLMFGIILAFFMFLKDNKKIFKILYLVIYSYLLYVLLLNDTFGCFLAVLLTIILIAIYNIFINKNLKKIIPLIVSFVFISMITYKGEQNIVLKNTKELLVDFKIIKEVIEENEETEEDENKIDRIGTTRGTLWRYGIKYIGNSPIIGNGIESTYYLYARDNVPQTRPHNILIQFGIFTGIPGIIFYIVFIGSILIRNLKKIKLLDDVSIISLFMVICYFISSMFGNSMFYTSPYFFIFLGIVCKNAFYKKELT